MKDNKAFNTSQAGSLWTCLPCTFNHILFAFFQSHTATLFNMKFSLLTLAALLSLSQAAPAELENRASCTFTDAASVAKSKTSCSTITLKGIAVPAGTTLDLTGLKSGTNVRANQNSH